MSYPNLENPGIDRPSDARMSRFHCERIHIFLALFTIVYLSESLGGMYIVGAIQNIEKEFELPSKVSGFLVSATDVGYIPTVVLISYMGARGNRARWIGAGTACMAVAYLAIASPHFFFSRSTTNRSHLYDDTLVPPTSVVAENASLAELLRYPLIKQHFTDDVSASLLSRALNVAQLEKPFSHPSTDHEFTVEQESSKILQHEFTVEQESSKILQHEFTVEQESSKILQHEFTVEQESTKILQHEFTVEQESSKILQHEFTVEQESSKILQHEFTVEQESSKILQHEFTVEQESSKILQHEFTVEQESSKILQHEFTVEQESSKILQHEVTVEQESSKILTTPEINSAYTKPTEKKSQAVAEAKAYNLTDAAVVRLRRLLRLFVKRRLGKDAEAADALIFRRAVNVPFSFCAAYVNTVRSKITAFKCAENGGSTGAVIVFSVALLCLGVGRTLPWTLGVPLLDDNVSRKNMPLYFAPEGLTPNDSSWIGAWWIGFIMIACITVVPSIGLCLFPSKNILVSKDIGKRAKQINIVEKPVHKEVETTFKEKLKDFCLTYKSVVSRPIYCFSVIGRVLDMMAFKGYMLYLPKYLENHFGIPRFLVYRYMALLGVLGFASGSGVGGLLMRKLKLDGRRAVLFVIFVSLINIFTYTTKVFIPCDTVLNSLTDGRNSSMSTYDLESPCNADCACREAELYPVCDARGQAFFSPCHAGCRDMESHHGSAFVFSSCSCSSTGTVSKANCAKSCSRNKFLFFFTVVIGSFAAGLGLVPGLLILIRSIPPASRTAALALQGFLVSLFGTLPSPMIYGFIVDSACIIWKEDCDGTWGSCSIYDPHALRIRIHVVYICLRMISLIFDLLVYRYASGLELMNEDSASMAEDVQRSSIKMHELSSPQ